LKTYNGFAIENKFTHDAYGRLATREYPSGFKVSQSYNVNGYLKSIKGNNKTLWECLEMNPLGQITSHKQGSYTSQTGYDTYVELQSQSFANGRGMNYGFDNKGNMSYREDIHKNLKETFGYDELDRLNRIAYYVNGNHQVYLDRHIMYDNGGIGNISSITGVGSEFNYGEDDAGPHALTSVSRPEPGWRPGPQEIKYTAFNKASSIVDTAATGKTLSYSVYYGLDDQRRKSVFKDSGQVIRTKYYFGDYERINENSETKNYHYISSPTGLCAIFVTEGTGGQSQLWHAYTDHLGSLVYMVNADNSNDYKEYSYDAWGNTRDAADWTDSLSVPLFAGRGFTGHEHLEEFALINMNGRIYDPMLGRFFSPDPYVQLPGYAGSYNRYSYCLNNPLVYTDPDGEFIVEAILIGAFINTYIQNINSTGDFFLSMAVGGLSGLAGAGIGHVVAGAVGTIGFAGGALTGASGGFAGGFVGGAGNAWVGGASFSDGLKSGLVSGGIGAATGGLVGGISGGITASKNGGNFWTGKGATFDALATPVSGDKIEIGDGMDYSNDYAQQFSDNNFGKSINGLNELHADGTIPNGYSTRGDVVLNGAGQQVRGSTVYLGTGKGSNVLLYKAAFTSKEQLYFTMGHEYLHVAFNHAGVGHSKTLKRAKHASIYKWEAYQAKAWGFNEALYAKRYLENIQYYNSAYDYGKYGFYILSIRPW